MAVSFFRSLVLRMKMINSPLAKGERLSFYPNRNRREISRPMPRAVFRNPRIWALVSIVCPVLLAIILVFAAPFVPDYDPVRGLVSKLSLGPFGWLGACIFALLACTLGGFGRGLSCSVGRQSGFALPVRLIYAASLGFTILIFINISADRAVWTLERFTHWLIVGGSCASLYLGCWLMLGPLKLDEDWRRMYKPTLIMLVSVLALLLLLSLTVRVWHISGVYERVIGADVLIWIEAMSFCILRISGRNRLVHRG
jgi:hypothetical protein